MEGVNYILNPIASTPNYICILNILYIAVVIGVVINALPSERIKAKGNDKYDLSIIGAGDVVVNRLIPALEQMLRRMNVVIYDIDESRVEKSKRKDIRGNTFIYKKKDENFKKNTLNSSIVWIATPSSTHLTYLEEFMNEDVFIAIEKPLTSLKSEYSALRNLLKSDGGNKVFCLSYYYLEKALPLVFLFNPMAFYEKYLIFSKEKTRHEVLAAFSLLGNLKKVRLHLLEQNDERGWLKSNLYGGQYMETFIHLALLTRMVLGKKYFDSNPSWVLGDYQKDYKSTYIECIGKVEDVDYHLYMGKFMSVKKRRGRISYEYGEILIDFENSSCQCQFYKDSSLNFSISLNSLYPKYRVLFDMVERCYEESLIPSTIDGSELQLETLEWLFANNFSTVKHFDYDEKTIQDSFEAYHKKEGWKATETKNT